MKTELLELDYLMQEQFPKEIVDAYSKMVDAQMLFEESKKENAPNPPFKSGEFILLDRWNEGVWIEGKIASITYAPYSNRETLGAWRVCFLPLKKDFTPLNRITVNTIIISNSMKLTRVIL